MYALRSWLPSSIDSEWEPCFQPDTRCAACALFAGEETYRITLVAALLVLPTTQMCPGASVLRPRESTVCALYMTAEGIEVVARARSAISLQPDMLVISFLQGKRKTLQLVRRNMDRKVLGGCAIWSGLELR